MISFLPSPFTHPQNSTVVLRSTYCGPSASNLFHILSFLVGHSPPLPPQSSHDSVIHTGLPNKNRRRHRQNVTHTISCCNALQRRVGYVSVQIGEPLHPAGARKYELTNDDLTSTYYVRTALRRYALLAN